MKPTPPHEVHARIASSSGRLAVCFLKAAGCPNCEQAKPILSAMAAANPETEFLSVTVADGSEVTPGFQFRQFPGFFTFEHGQLVRAFSGLKTARQLSFAFSRPNDLKVAAWDAQEAAKFIGEELATYSQGCGYQAPSPVAHVVPAIMPPEGDPNEEACDSCI